MNKGIELIATLGQIGIAVGELKAKNAALEGDRALLIAALERISALDKQFMHACDCANEALKIAREALVKVNHG